MDLSLSFEANRARKPAVVVTLKIPIDVYQALICLCDQKSQQYKFMINGIIHGNMLTILSELEAVQSFVDWAERTIPEIKIQTVTTLYK